MNVCLGNIRVETQSSEKVPLKTNAGSGVGYFLEHKG